MSAFGTEAAVDRPSDSGGFLPVRIWGEAPRKRTFARAVTIDSFAPTPAAQAMLVSEADISSARAFDRHVPIALQKWVEVRRRT